MLPKPINNPKNHVSPGGEGDDLGPSTLLRGRDDAETCVSPGVLSTIPTERDVDRNDSQENI